MKPITVALADDHVLLRNGLASLLENMGYEVLFEASDGKEVIKKITKERQPDVMIMDVSMTGMGGIETTLWLRENFPLVNVLMLTMYEDETTIIRALRNGAKGYILKDVEPKEFRAAIEGILFKGFYHSDMVTGKLIHSIRAADEDENVGDLGSSSKLNQRELQFLKLVSTEMTYKEIAAEMHLSPRTIDGYRDALFEKLGLKSRTGLVIFAIKNGIVQLY